MTRHAGKPPLRPDRVRRIDKRGFAFLPNRLLHDGFFASLGHGERSLYFFLLLAGDRSGVSFYSCDRICATLQMTLDEYIAVRNSLIDRDPIAFDGTRFQILSLPPSPVRPQQRELRSDDDFERHDPATVRQLLRGGFDGR